MTDTEPTPDEYSDEFLDLIIGSESGVVAWFNANPFDAPDYWPKLSRAVEARRAALGL